MKRRVCILIGGLCLLLVSFYIIFGDVFGETVSGELSSEEKTESWDDGEPAYVKAYTEFLLAADIDQDGAFPIRGYYLFDLNFDDIPELGILHDSWGSMGGYFTYYYFDGNGITAVLNDQGEQARVSNYTQILADFEQKKVYLLKEMYLLLGNENGTYGYVKEIKSEGQNPWEYDVMTVHHESLAIHDILNLEVDQGRAFDYIEKEHNSEDGFLSDSDLEDCLITQCYMGEEWIDISSDEYLKQKRELIPEENDFVDLLEGASNYLGANYDDNGDLLYTDVRMGKEEIEQLFRRFAQSLE